MNSKIQLHNTLNFYILPKTTLKCNFENKKRNQEPIFKTTPKQPLIVLHGTLSATKTDEHLQLENPHPQGLQFALQNSS